MDYSGKVAVVTGASRGIGRDIAAALARHGAGLAITGRTESDLQTAAADFESLGAKVRSYPCDVSNFEAVQAVAEAVQEEFGGADYLINNAGIVRDRLLLRMTPDDWEQVLAVNLTGAYNTTKAFSSQLLRKRSCRIVNITSVVGLAGNAGQANYAASKAGIIGLTKSLAKEFASREVTVNAVAPGYIHTAMTVEQDETIKNKMLEMIPLGRFGTGEDVANVVMFLLSDRAGYITGQVINCDGGMVMN